MQGTIGLDITQVTAAGDVPAFRLGTKGVLETDDGTKEYIYAKIDEAVTFASQVVQFYGIAGGVALLDDATGNIGRGARVGVCPVIAAINTYAWIQVYGRATVGTLASFAIGAKAYVTATPGYIDDAATIGLESIDGMYCGVATGGAPAGNTSFTLNYPSVGVTA